MSKLYSMLPARVLTSIPCITTPGSLQGELFNTVTKESSWQSDAKGTKTNSKKVCGVCFSRTGVDEIRRKTLGDH